MTTQMVVELFLRIIAGGIAIGAGIISVLMCGDAITDWSVAAANGFYPARRMLWAWLKLTCALVVGLLSVMLGVMVWRG